MILDRLRDATGQAHRRLEADLALLHPPLDRARFVEALRGFHAFHRIWEPLAELRTGDADFLRGRRRLRLLESDLAALGARPPLDAAEIDFLDTPGRAWGSVYVMEGSTLGGKVIARALAGAPWLPAGGLRYFDPYGRAAGARWRELVARLAGAAQAHPAEHLVEGAVATFEALRLRLAVRRELAA